MAQGHNNHAKALIDTWDVVVRYRWRLILPTFLVVAAVLATSLFLPRKFRAKAIFERRTDMVLTEVIQRGAVPMFDNPQHSIVEQIAGQPAIDELIESLQGPETANLLTQLGHPNLESLRSELERKINVGFDIAAPHLDRINVTFINEDPKLARAVVNTLVENYIDHTRDQIDRHLRQAAEFFDHEVAAKRTVIEDLENQKLTFEIRHAELLPDSPGSIQEVLTDAQMQMITLQQEREATNMRVEALQNMISDSPLTVPKITTAKNPEMSRLEAKLRELTAQLETYTGEYKMTDRHPDLTTLREQIGLVREEMLITATDVVTEKQIDVNHKREQLELDLNQANIHNQSIQKQIISLQTQIDRLNAQSADIFPVRSEYQKLSRQIDQARRQLAFWEDNLGRVQVALAAEAGNRGVSLSFIKPCDAINKPTSPDLIQVIVVALVLGISAGGSNVFLAYRTDESFSDADDLADTIGLPLFGSVSEIISNHQRRVRRLAKMVLYPVNISAMAAVLLLLVALLYVDLEKPEWFDPIQKIAPIELGGEHETAKIGPLAADLE